MNAYGALAFLGVVGLGVMLWLQDRAEWRRAIAARDDTIEDLEDELEDMRNMSDNEEAWQWN